MPRERLTLAALVEANTFDPSNRRRRRALDESGPLDDPELEEARRHVLDLRGPCGARVRGAEALQDRATRGWRIGLTRTTSERATGAGRGGGDFWAIP